MPVAKNAVDRIGTTLVAQATEFRHKGAMYQNITSVARASFAATQGDLICVMRCCVSGCVGGGVAPTSRDSE
jgi:hypothetical protein